MGDVLGDYDEEEPIEKRFEDLCNELCIEGNIREESWEKYKDVWTNYAIDGDQIQWLVCSLYECCRKTNSDTMIGHVVENAYVSLTRLLKAAKMSLVQFFHRIKKWAEMTEMTEEMRDRIDRLESQFAVSSVVFKKYPPIFSVLFNYTGTESMTSLEGGDTLTVVTKSTRSGGRSAVSGIKKKLCTVNDVFNFSWVLFIKVKANYPAICDELVNSYHLLLCCLDWVYGNALMSGFKDLLHPDFRGLPRDFHTKEFRAPEVLPCVLRAICEDRDVNYVECKTIKEYFLKPYLNKLFDKEVLKGRSVSLSAVLEPTNFDVSSRALNDIYEEYIMGTGDFDERMFLSPQATEEIGTISVERDSKHVAVLSSDLTPCARRYMQEVTNSSYGPLGINTMTVNSNKRNEASILSRLHATISFNNPESRGQNLTQLQGLLMGRSRDASDALIGLLDAHCSPSTLTEIRQRLDDMSSTFTSVYTNNDPIYNDSAMHRLGLAHSLYYMALENILLDEINKIERRTEITGRRVKPDLTGLMSTDRLHRSLLACCLEVVLLSCDTAHRFPWILDALELEAFHFYKMVEIVIKNVDFPRDIVKYLNQVVEHIIDTYAWRSDSPLWGALSALGKAPSIEEVIHPDKIDHDTKGSGNGGIGSAKKLIMDSSIGGAGDQLGGGGSHKRFVSSAGRWGIQGEGDESARAAANLLSSQSGLSMDDKNTVQRGIVRHDSVALFFRQVYCISSLRLRDMCDRLNLNKDLLAKIWTCFEHVLVDETHVMQDRSLDQILICCVFSLAKVACTRQIGFLDIIQVYRMQPQAVRDVYRNVLLSTESLSSGSNKEDHFIEKRSDITTFYNQVFLPKMAEFVKRFTTTFQLTATASNLSRNQPTLSPMPLRNFDSLSSHGGGSAPSRRLATNRNIFISPVKTQVHLSPKRIVFSVSNSPSKELREINTMISTAERKILMANMSLGIKRPGDRLGMEMSTSAAKRLNFD